MILKNYIVLKERIIYGGTISGSVSMLTAYKDTTGASRSGVYGNYSPLKDPSPVIGSGDTAVTADDYALANDVTSSFSNITISATRTIAIDENGLPYMTKQMTIGAVNNSGAAITVKEVGLIYKDFHYTSGSYYCNVLLAREVLTTPVEVAAGDSFSIPMQWVEY